MERRLWDNDPRVETLSFAVFSSPAEDYDRPTDKISLSMSVDQDAASGCKTACLDVFCQIVQWKKLFRCHKNI